jgi:4-hydroxy-tetrahydrodipicolinate synthase
MNKPLFTGVCTALVTPFLDGNVNYPMAEQLLKRQIDAGINAVVLSGTTGESSTLTNDEKIELISRSKKYVGNQCLVIAGTGSNNTAQAIELSQAAEEAGADALLVVSPYYNKATPEGLFRHYVSIAHAVSIPIILYNVPTRTGVDMPVSVYQRLSNVPNIVGVKEASNNIVKVGEILSSCKNFALWSGNDDQIVPTISMGASGVISVLSNVLPEETLAITNAALSGDFTTAASLQRQLLPMIDFLFCEVNPIPVKAVLQKIGFDCGSCRLPLCELSEGNLQRLNKFFA